MPDTKKQTKDPLGSILGMPSLLLGELLERAEFGLTPTPDGPKISVSKALGPGFERAKKMREQQDKLNQLQLENLEAEIEERELLGQSREEFINSPDFLATLGIDPNHARSHANARELIPTVTERGNKLFGEQLGAKRDVLQSGLRMDEARLSSSLTEGRDIRGDKRDEERDIRSEGREERRGESKEEDARAFLEAAMTSGAIPADSALGRAVQANFANPPSAEDVRMAQTFNQTQPRQEISGTPADFQDPVTRRNINSQIVLATETIQNMNSILAEVDPRNFTTIDGIMSVVDQKMSRFLGPGALNERQIAAMERRAGHKSRSGLGFFVLRKFFTGVAGGEVELIKMEEFLPNANDPDPFTYMTKARVVLDAAQRTIERLEALKALSGGDLSGMSKQQGQAVVEGAIAEAMMNPQTPAPQEPAQQATDLNTLSDEELRALVEEKRRVESGN